MTGHVDPTRERFRAFPDLDRQAAVAEIRPIRMKLSVPGAGFVEVAAS